MNDNKGKISLNQALLLFLVLFCSPAIRFLPTYTASFSKQAAWLVPFVSLIIYTIYILLMNMIYKKYKKESFVDIIKDVLGNVVGNIVIAIFFIWITFLLIYNIRIFSERLLGSVIPNMDSVIIIAIMLVLVGYVLKSGIVIVSRMNEIFFVFTIAILIISGLLLLPKFEISNLFPISYKDIVPILKGSSGPLALFSYVTILLMFSDKIVSRENYKKIGIKLILGLTLISLLLIISTLCIFGWALIVKMPIPFINTVMEISFFDTIERIEAVLIMFWIITDFISISVFTYSAIHIIGVNLKISKTNSLLIIYIVFLFFMSFCIAKSTVELSALSVNILVPLNIAVGYCLPIIIFCIAKIRKKLN